MKLNVEQSLDIKEVEITIKCALIDDELERLIAQIRLFMFSVSGIKDGKLIIVKLEDVYYIEAVDNKTFLYCEKEVLETRLRLFELEDRLENTSFVRISKSCILNTSRLASVKSYFNGRMEAHLKNGESVIISRHYLGDIKKKLGLI